MHQSRLLRELILADEILVMPDAFDPLSARMIQQAGFRAVQCSGYCFSIAALYREEADLPYADHVAMTRRIVQAVQIPVMADGEDGFGNPSQIPQTIRDYIEAGVSGINLEDQILNGNHKGGVIEAGVMAEKIRLARVTADSSANPDLVINGRTDALNCSEDRQKGIDAAVRRANLYLGAGADLVFITGVSSLADVQTLVKRVEGPLSVAAGLPYNIRSFSVADLRSCGVARVSLPSILIFACIQAMKRALESVEATEGFAELLRQAQLCSGEDLRQILEAG